VRTSVVFGSTSARLSFVFAVLIIAAFLLAGITIWAATRNTAELELRQAIELEVSAIETEYETEGLEAAIAAVKARAELPGALEYWLSDSKGLPLLGNFPGMQGPEGWRHLKVSEDAVGAEKRREMLVLTETLGGGVELSVGDDFGRAHAVQQSVLTTLAGVGGFALLASLLVGTYVTRRTLSGMKLLDTALAKVASGDIEARFPVRMGSNSDVERVGIAVNAMLDRIEQLMADVRRVSRDIAHDLRTPITHLQQRLERAKTMPAGSEQIAVIEAAQDKIEEILRVFGALLRLSEIRARPSQDRKNELELADVVEKVVDAYRPDVEESGHELTLSVASRCRVLGDPDLITQAVANLIENAMRHTPVGSRITVRVDSDGDTPRIEVDDNGPGIPAADRQRVLEPFTRLDSSRSTPGSGLGLSMVAAIADFHSARVVLGDAEPGLRVSIEFDPSSAGPVAGPRETRPAPCEPQ
jgi:signal transduction histidine kinase